VLFIPLVLASKDETRFGWNFLLTVSSSAHFGRRACVEFSRIRVTSRLCSSRVWAYLDHLANGRRHVVGLSYLLGRVPQLTVQRLSPAEPDEQ
jgi:hypothetical protein